MFIGKVRNHGFTLIELLVVIAIIALLAAVLFPVFAKAREKARQSTCLSNEKQLSIGVLQYVQDYEEMFPNGYMGFGNGQNVTYGQGWAGQIFGYVKSTAVFHCPNDATNNLSQANLDVHLSNGQYFTNAGQGNYPVSYGYNRDLVQRVASSNTVHPAYTQAKLIFAANTLLFFECQGQMADITNINNAQGAGGSVDGSSPAGNGVWSASNNNAEYAGGLFAGAPARDRNNYLLFLANAVHSDGANYAFTDGHTKWMRAAAISAGWTNQNPSDRPCGAYPSDYTSGTTTVDGVSGIAGGEAASADAMGKACSGQTPIATFSPT